jgi:hypothetical protein
MGCQIFDDRLPMTFKPCFERVRGDGMEEPCCFDWSLLKNFDKLMFDVNSVRARWYRCDRRIEWRCRDRMVSLGL